MLAAWALGLQSAAAANAPVDREAPLIAARAAIAQQDAAAATRLLEAARAQDPNNADLLRLLGSAYAYRGRYELAITTLRRAEAIAPHDLDIKAALARAYLWSGQLDAARQEVALIKTMASDNADAREIATQIDTAAAAPRPSRLGLAVTQSVAHVDFAAGGRQTWLSTTLAFFGTVARNTTVSLQAEREDRQSAVDTRIEARVDQRFGRRIVGHLSIAGTPNADFRERLSVAAGIDATITPAIAILADVRRADYGRGVVVTALEPGVRLTLPATGFSVAARMINLWDETGQHRAGVSGRVEKQFGEGLTIYAGGASYPDTEARVTRTVNAAFAGAVVPLSSRITLRGGFDYEQRAASYTRTGGSLSLQVKF